MKKFILVLSFIATVLTVKAQNCTPTWPTGAGAGIMPDSATNLPLAHEAEAYTAVVQFKVPYDTTANIAGFDVDIIVDSITIDGVTGLDAIPSSVAFTYVSNPVSGTFYGDSLGCVLISGTPNDTAHGDYPIVVEVTAHATIVSLGQQIEQPYTIDYYHIFVDWSTGVSIVDMREKGIMISPTLANNKTTITYFTTAASNSTIIVSNLLGQNVLVENFATAPGANTNELDVREFADGQYIVSLLTDGNVYTSKMIVSK